MDRSQRDPCPQGGSTIPIKLSVSYKRPWCLPPALHGSLGAGWVHLTARVSLGAARQSGLAKGTCGAGQPSV